MGQSIHKAALSAVSLLLLTWSAAAQTFSSAAAATTTAGTGLKPISTLACYKSYSPLTLYGEWQFATDGWCQEQCGALNQPVMALTGGSTCYCGGQIPAADQQVSNSSCSSPCNGYGLKNCGGDGFWQVYLTGLTTNVQVAPNSTTSSSTSSSALGGSSTTSASPSVITKAGETVVVTAAASNTAAAQGGSTSKVGIAVGVVVGLLVVASCVGGLVFVLRQRRKRAIEEEHQRNAAIASKKTETISTDARLDPVIFSHRRESIGSIADEMDYSRRILQVRNPDYRSSQQSNLVP